MSSARPGYLLALAPYLDGLAVAMAGWFAYFLRWHSWTLPATDLVAIVMGAALALVLLPLGGAYRTWRGGTRWTEFGNALPGLIAVALLLILLAAATKTTAHFSRLWMGYWLISAIVALGLSRLLWRRLQSYLESNADAAPRIVIVGDGDFAKITANNIISNATFPRKVVGFIGIGDHQLPANLPAPIIGDIDSLLEIIGREELALDEVWVAVSDSGVEVQAPLLRLLQNSCIPVRYVPDLSLLPLLNHVPIEVSGMTVIVLNASPLWGSNAIIKAVFDRVFSLAAVLVTAPLILIIAAAIKLDSTGPVFFRQKRHGWDGRTIEVLKFRTMRSEPGQSGDCDRQAVANDQRVTRVGRVLRRSSLDELPQFFNVLRGDMSVVGPRPHPVSLNKQFSQQINAYMQRHRVKPGITGWAQINGLRGETDTLAKMQKRVDYDLYYIEHWSLWLDMKIIAATLTRGWTGDNVY